MRCNEPKDDDYGQWTMTNEGSVKIVRGCRQCGHRLTMMSTLKEILPEFYDDIISRRDY